MLQRRRQPKTSQRESTSPSPHELALAGHAARAQVRPSQQRLPKCPPKVAAMNRRGAQHAHADPPRQPLTLAVTATARLMKGEVTVTLGVHGVVHGQQPPQKMMTRRRRV